MSGRIESSRNHNGTSEDVTNYVFFGLSNLVALNQISKMLANFSQISNLYFNTVKIHQVFVTYKV